MRTPEPDRQETPTAEGPATGHPPRLLTVEDLGRMLSIGPRGARKALEKGVLPGFRLGRRWYCRLADLEARIAALVEEEKANRGPDAARVLRGLGRRKV